MIPMIARSMNENSLQRLKLHLDRVILKRLTELQQISLGIPFETLGCGRICNDPVFQNNLEQSI